MKKALLLVFACTFLLFACETAKEETTTISNSSSQETTADVSGKQNEATAISNSSSQEDTADVSGKQRETIVVTDPQNEYDNNKLVFHFEDNVLVKVEYIIVFETQESALLAKELYQAYAAEYNLISLDGLTLTVEYGSEMRTQYPAAKDELLTYLNLQGYIVTD